VEEISEALEIRHRNPVVLLGGERGGLRIGADQTGGIEFDLGNSPREYTSERVSGRTIVITTTNGTRSLRACAGAGITVVGSFLNLRAAAEFVLRRRPEELWLVCAGTGRGAALEDTLAAGAFCDLVISRLPSCDVRDSAQITLQTYHHSKNDVVTAIRSSQNARRLLANPVLRDDVEFCLRRDCFSPVPVLGSDGVIRNVSETFSR
jgi:2-phosphosulfolactate phosphatase